MNKMIEVADKTWSWAFCRAIRARQQTKELLRETKDDLAAALAQLRTAGLLPAVESSNFLKLRMDPSEYTLDPPKPGRTPPQPIKKKGLFR